MTVLCEKSKIVSFASPIIKNVVAPPSRSKFPVIVICCTTFGSASRACYLIKSIAIIL